MARLRQKQRGFVLIVMTAAAIALMGGVGLAVDLGRVFIAKNETQIYVDAAAIAAAQKLDGTANGITNANNAVTAMANAWNLDSTNITGATVDYGQTSSGPWSTNPSPAANYMYSRVRVTVAAPLYFLPVVTNLYSQNVNSVAVAGQISVSADQIPRGLAPFSGVAQSSAAPDYGMVRGQEYDLQWPQYNNTRAGCGPSDPDRCFNSPTCANESMAAKISVVNDWSSATNGYWGYNANSSIAAALLDYIQLQAVEIGTNLDPVMSNGNKAVEAQMLDLRASRDPESTNNLDTYMASTIKNGQRLIAVPILLPSSTTSTPVVGYGSFLLYSNGYPNSNYYAHATNGNDPFCAIYAGPYVLGGSNPGGGTTGFMIVKLVG